MSLFAMTDEGKRFPAESNPWTWAAEVGFKAAIRRVG